ncbi:hypothetical protein GHT07_13570 [Caenimonas koreensis DSM 17982]|uniref:Uncharacterized protein n=1 Tax=Caenimonas koreensis DSM 17982 TaxID=1121255 RepID=A0A844B516_9BURK|nr:hypothetical protein [Caenimonas koreensis]MRD48313.1 hypothetical protein [Caenimonas koreensis DSM 17982]
MHHQKKPPRRARSTANTPLKDVLASCEVTPGWGRVISRLTEGTPLEQTPSLLQQLGSERALAGKRLVPDETTGPGTGAATSETAQP